MRTLVVGMGRSGRECARFLAASGASFDTFDDRLAREAFADLLSAADFQHFRSVAELDPSRYQEVVTSPGVPSQHPVLAAMRRAGVRICSEIELAFRHARGKIIAVTGSNGKSTTVSLVRHVLDRHGVRATLCGNIGIPFIGRVEEDEGHVYVLEVSSFQLEHIHDFCPDVGILLNISPDHLDRHGSFAVYEQTKLRLFENQKPGHLALVPESYAKRIPGRAEVVTVPGARARLEGESLILDDGFRLDSRRLTLPGEHNRLNLLFACCALRSMGLSGPDVERGLASFEGLEHRMEPVGKVEGRIWINDSKATNTQATQAALETMSGPFVLILGGRGKGRRFDDLRFEKRPPTAIVAYGESAQRIVADLAAWHPEPVHEFRAACIRAHALAAPDGHVLLAPACASFDQFESYQARGRGFKAIFQEMKDRYEQQQS